MIMCLIVHFALIMAWLSQVREADDDDAKEEKGDYGCLAVGISGSSSSSSSLNANISKMSLVFRMEFHACCVSNALAMATVVPPSPNFSHLAYSLI